MKIMSILFIATLSFVNLAVESYAQTVYFKKPMEFAGTGCGTGSYTFSGDGTDTLSILFSEYDAADPADGAMSGLRHASCSFAVPIHVPSGYQVSVLTSDWRGFAQGSTELFREYFFAGETGGSKTSNPNGNYTERDDGLQYESSLCGKDVILRINSSIQATGSGSYIAVDSADLKNSLEIYVQLEKCKSPLSAVFNLLL